MTLWAEIDMPFPSARWRAVASDIVARIERVRATDGTDSRQGDHWQTLSGPVVDSVPPAVPIRTVAIPTLPRNARGQLMRRAS